MLAKVANKRFDYKSMNIFQETDSQLVGISGTNHSGKDTAGEYLENHHSFMHVSMSDVLRAEARQQGLDTARPTLIEIGVKLREQYGLGAVVLRGIEQWQKERNRFVGGLVLSSIRVIGEAEEIKRQGGTLLFVDAPAEIRHKRATDPSRVRGDETFKTFEEYVEQEKIELEGLGGPNRPNLRAVQAMADATILNNGGVANYVHELEVALSLAATA